MCLAFPSGVEHANPLRDLRMNLNAAPSRRRYHKDNRSRKEKISMKKRHLFAFALVAVIGYSSMVFAQNNRTRTPRIDQREQHQQDRVADGLKDGSITSGEAARIERQEAKIQRDEAAAKADGVVTRRERARLNRELNHTSREIHHNRGNTPNIDQREQRQQNRIANGLKNGSLTSGEAARIERQETKIQRDEAAAKADGVVTRREQARLNRELNHTNREIRRDKHNGRRQ
jgi:uncharacterized membrane protein YebE (DUF533 family)